MTPRTFAHLPDEELRSLCRETIESLEHWLRRLIDEVLSPRFGNVFEAVDGKGNRLLRKGLSDDVARRRASEPGRYPREIDAISLDDVIDILCRPDLFPLFRNALNRAFPDGPAEARTFLRRISWPRNHLSHANSISHRQAEQVLCYSADVIDSLKQHYIDMGMHQQFNVPLILRFSDSFGNTFTREQTYNAPLRFSIANLRDTTASTLRPGDTISVQVEIDPSFDETEYSVTWDPAEGSVSGAPMRFSLMLSNRQVGENWSINCQVTSKKQWHRMNSYDDRLMIMYRVLPPVE